MTHRSVGIWEEEGSWGEAAPLSGLSLESEHEAEAEGTAWAREGEEPATASGCMALDMVRRDRGGGAWFDGPFLRGEGRVKINGLIWMGSEEWFREQVESLLAQQFEVIKMKVSARTLNQDCARIKWIKSLSADVQIRVDANGAFALEEAKEALHRLADAGAESIEQPIQAGQAEAMRTLCAHAPLAVALDEELIGIRSRKEKAAILDEVRPARIVLKPSLIGGFHHAEEWADLAEERGIGWWATSALESNLGLAALAQWLAARGSVGVHGLGTGSLYRQNFRTPLRRDGQHLYWDPEGEWSLALAED
jgi:L-alanine-DL-glutamate epimerase-like enolase superfamily enzyme